MLSISPGSLSYRRHWHYDREHFRLTIRDTVAIDAGSRAVVLGANGIGKSTLLRFVGDLDQSVLKSSGAKALWNTDPAAACATYLAAAPEFLPVVSVIQYAELAFRYRYRACKTPYAESSGDDVKRTLEQYGVPSTLWRKEPRALSSGQRKRLGLARVALQGFPVVLLDEPRANLDSAGEALVPLLVNRIVDCGGVAVIATHEEVDAQSSQVRLLLQWATTGEVVVRVERPQGAQ